MTIEHANDLTAIDLFCGSGAVSSGLKASDFKVLAAVDNDPIACKTYELNHPEVLLIQQDIRCVSPKMLASKLNLSQRLDLLVVCAPCQPFSTQNRRKDTTDARTKLIMEMLPFVAQFKPRLIFIENVPGIIENGPLTDLQRDLSASGYYLSNPKTLDASDMGVPQRRKRCIMIATPCEDVARKFGENILPIPVRTVRAVIGHLPSLRAGEIDSADSMHQARAHSPLVLERLKHIPKDGGSRSSLPPELELMCHKGKSKSFSDVYGRMKWDALAPTLTTGCTEISKGRFAHPEDDRGISLREAALLQTFPQDYQFHGNLSEISRQIGNAVPVEMIKALAPYLKEAIVQKLQ